MVTRKASLACTAAFVAFSFIASAAFAVIEYGGIDNGEQRTAIPANEIVEPRLEAMSPVPQIVVASWYGEFFQGKLMANGKPFDMHKLTVAHKSLRLGTRIRIQNPENGRVVIARVTDRGPYVSGREIDLSKQAAKLLGLLEKGVGLVEIVSI